MSETSWDLRENITALTIAICYQDFLLPEAAFCILSGESYKLTDKDKEDMLKLREEGYSYTEIGKLYGYVDTRVYKIIKRYKAKKETLQGGNLSKVSV